MTEEVMEVTEPVALDETLQTTNAKIEAQTAKMEDISSKLTTLATNLQTIGTNISTTNTKLENLNTSLGLIATAINKLVDRDEQLTGKLLNLTTSQKDNLVKAINEVASATGNTTNITDLAYAIANLNLRRNRKSSFDLATLKKAVADNNLEKYGLAPGDYTTINGRTYVIAGLNPMKGTSTPYRVNVNHVGLIVIPHTTTLWNASGNTSTGANGRGAGYANCDLHYYLKNTVLPWCQTDLGSGNLIAHSKLLTTAVNTSGYNRYGSPSGCSSSWDWYANQYISALSEVQVYGGTVWSSSGYDTGEACRLLDVFQRFSHTEIFGGEYPWLRDVVSASSAAYAYHVGYANYYPVSHSLSVAALILFH